MRESKIEKYFTDRCKEHDIMALKLISVNFNGLPDRLALFPSGRIVFVELKTPETDLRPIQRVVHRKLKEHNATVVTLHSLFDVDLFIEEYAV